MRSIALQLALLCLAPSAGAQDWVCTSIADCSYYRSLPDGDSCSTLACWDEVFKPEPPSYAAYYSAAMQMYGQGRIALSDSLLRRAYAGEPTNEERARFFGSLASKRIGARADHLAACLGYDPLNGNCLFIEAGLKGDAARAAAGSSVEGRAAYWCMADVYRNVAAVTSGQIARAARSAAAQYERAGPSREQYFFSTSWRPGQTVSASLGAYGHCSTRVR